jgi:hypothetical protein
MKKNIKKIVLLTLIVVMSLSFMGCEIPEELEQRFEKETKSFEEKSEKIKELVPKESREAFEEKLAERLEERQDVFEKNIEKKLEEISDKDIDIKNLSEDEQMEIIVDLSEESLEVLFDEAIKFIEIAEIILEDTALEYISEEDLLILDLEPSDWAVSSIATAKRQNLTKSIALNDLKEDISRKEFATLVANIYEDMSGKRITMLNKNTFEDTDDENILKAAKIGIVNGVGEGRFDPEGKVTREQMAVMMKRLMDSLDINPTVTMEYRYFADEDEISDWAKSSVQVLNKLEIINGIGQQKIAPKGSATKEQAIVMGIRLYERFK